MLLILRKINAIFVFGLKDYTSEYSKHNGDELCLY
jgi:hypothetical protein